MQLILPYLVSFFGILITTGLFTNLFLCYLTYKTKSLRGACSKLIALCAFFDALHTFFGHIFMVIDILSGTNTRRTTTCLLMQLPAIVGVAGGTCTALSIGIDRFIACTVPRRYTTITSGVGYAALHATPILANCMFMIYIAYINLGTEEEVICYVAEAFRGEAKLWFMIDNLGTQIIAVVLYGIVGWRLLATGQISQFPKIFRSLFLVLIIVLGGWVTTSVFGIMAFENNRGHPDLQFLYGLIAGLAVNTALSLNPIVYYLTSTDYRNAVKTLIGKKSHVRELSTLQTIPMTY